MKFSYKEGFNISDPFLVGHDSSLWQAFVFKWYRFEILKRWFLTPVYDRCMMDIEFTGTYKRSVRFMCFRDDSVNLRVVG